jgi:hypothetical protein
MIFASCTTAEASPDGQTDEIPKTCVMHPFNAYTPLMQRPSSHVAYNASPALFSISAVFLIALAAASQSFFSIASRTKGKTEDSSPLLASGAKMTCLNWSRPGN